MITLAELFNYLTCDCDILNTQFIVLHFVVHLPGLYGTLIGGSSCKHARHFVRTTSTVVPRVTAAKTAAFLCVCGRDDADHAPIVRDHEFSTALSHLPTSGILTKLCTY